MLLSYLNLINLTLHRWAGAEYPRRFNYTTIANIRGALDRVGLQNQVANRIQ